MITGATKSKVDDIWQKMWEGGITNPLEVISQLTYLMFIRSLDEKEFEIVIDHGSSEQCTDMIHIRVRSCGTGPVFVRMM